MLSDKRRIEVEAQQSYRFYLRINDLHVAYISQVSRPSYTIGTQQYKLLNHFFTHPTDIKWNPITFTVREIFSKEVFRSVGATIINKLREGAYDYPSDIDAVLLKDLSKDDLMKSLGAVSIQMLDPDGEIYEEWSLHGAFISDAKFSDLNYSQQDLTGITITLQYDWAELSYFRK